VPGIIASRSASGVRLKNGCAGARRNEPAYDITGSRAICHAYHLPLVHPNRIALAGGRHGAWGLLLANIGLVLSVRLAAFLPAFYHMRTVGLSAQHC
jgi:hypothetical protein